VGSITGSVMVKNTLPFISFILVDLWVTVSRKVNSQNNRRWCYEYPHVAGDVPFTSSEVVVTALKS
jgi:hypothetical protein